MFECVIERRSPIYQKKGTFYVRWCGLYPIVHFKWFSLRFTNQPSTKTTKLKNILNIY